MNQLKHFDFKGNNVRTVVINGEPHWVLKDVCAVLDLRAADVRQRLSDDVVSTHPIPDSLGRMQDTTIINEDGLYDVILESRKPEAKAFRKWITSEVIPQIRKTGSYGVNQYQLPQTFSDALRLAADLSDKNEKLQTKIESDKPKVLFAESYQVSEDSILVGEMAKILKQNQIEIGGTRFFHWLRQNGYLIKYGDQYNMPTQRSMDLGIMEIKNGTRQGSDGTVKITRTPKITGKGQVYFINKFKKATA